MSIRGAALPVSTRGVQRWTRRASLFREMLSAMYGGAAPAAQSSLSRSWSRLPSRVEDLKNKSVVEQRQLEDIAQQGREGRSRLGFAVDALGVDASRAREDLRMGEETLATANKRAQDGPTRLIAAVRGDHVLGGPARACKSPRPTWPRPTATQPTSSTSGTSRRTPSARRRPSLDKQRQALRDLEYQITQLRESLTKHETEVEAQRAQCERVVSRMSKEIDHAESELLEMATTFCAPLRGKPELLPLFARLEAA